MSGVGRAPDGAVDAGVNATASTVEEQRTALKRVGVALKATGLPFALAGGYAAWVHGAPEPVHDVDFVARPGDATALQEAFAQQGFVVQRPPEDWLFKVESDGVLVDVLHRGGGEPVDDALLGRARVHEVLSVELPVLSATDVMTAKLCVYDEHTCDFAPGLRVARSIREAVDWPQVAARTAHRPFAQAFLHLLSLLRVV